VNSLCFSPDGTTLASGGNGKVLLWDVADLTAGAAMK
jgi:WD40 repeat protein